MKGLPLCALYYHEVVGPMLARNFAAHKERIAVGLVGEGSECFGFDDELSRDHDFTPMPCLWITGSDLHVFGTDLKKALALLPQTFSAYQEESPACWGEGRRGLLEIGPFYRKYTGLERAPETLAQWRAIPEENLAVAVNGQVFADPLGEFTAIRSALLQFYPEDVRRKKIAARCMKMAQSGQYNYPRALKRQEYIAARLAEGEFINSTASMVYLLNRRYKPFYKWMHRGMKDLPLLGREVHDLLARLAAPEFLPVQARTDLVEEICLLVIGELMRQGLSEGGADFLLDHGPRVQEKISDGSMRALSPWQD